MPANILRIWNFYPLQDIIKKSDKGRLSNKFGIFQKRTTHFFKSRKKSSVMIKLSEEDLSSYLPIAFHRYFNAH